MKKQEQGLTQKRKQFNEKYKYLTKSEVQKELLFAQQLTIDKLEKIRTNTSNIVWWLIAIPIIVAVILGVS